MDKNNNTRWELIKLGPKPTPKELKNWSKLFDRQMRRFEETVQAVQEVIDEMKDIVPRPANNNSNSPNNNNTN